MKNTVYFSICRYVPSLLRGETLNIGFAYHVPSTGHLDFFTSKNTARIRNFDDEIETDMISVIFDSLKYDFSSENLETHDEYSNGELISPNLLNNKIKNYVNQVQFSEVSVFELDESVDNIILDIADMYLYYDKKKNERINHDRVRALAKKIVAASTYKDSMSKTSNIETFFDVPYDFKFNLGGHQKYIKGFSFDYKQPNRFFKEIKAYLFDLEHEMQKGTVNLEDIKIVINNTDFDKEHEKIITDYLPGELELITLEKFSALINNDQQKFAN